MSEAFSSPTSVHSDVKKWMGELDLARKREKDWRKCGKKVQEIYEGCKAEDTPFNVLYSNTETLAPALYAQIPRPAVERRFKDDEDKLGAAVVEASNRGLTYLLDTNSEDYETFDAAVKASVLDALIPGRGGLRLRYDAKVEGAEGSEQVSSELVCVEHFEWTRMLHGYAEKWCDVPWVAFEHYFNELEVKEHFGAVTAGDTRYSADNENTNRDEKDQDKDTANPKSNVKTACFYEIWNKADKSIIWVSPDYPKGIVKTLPDPLGLTGFYPMPEPLRLLDKAANLLPTAIYTQYENQAKELNTVTLRLNALIKACKARGIYNGNLGKIEDVLQQDENTLVAVENAQSLDGGLDKAIWFMPIDKIVAVVQQLYLARQQCKQVIYEITGISDIMRGQSQASETLGAQEIKQQWGTMRLKKMQKAVSTFVRDSMRLMLEIAGKKFDEQTWAAMTELPFLSQEQVTQAMQAEQAARQMLVQASTMQPPPLPGQPPQPPPPQLMQAQQAQQQAQAELQKPKWSEVLGVLKSDMQRQYRVDIETNSTIDPEATEDKEQIAEVMNAMSQFLNGVAPLIENGTMPFEVAQAMLLAIVRNFRWGPKIERYIEQMKPPTPPQDPNAAAKAQAEQTKAQSEQAKMQLEMQIAQQEMEFQKQEHQMKMEEMRMKVQVAQILGQAKIETARATAAHQNFQANIKTQQMKEQGVAKLEQQKQEGALRVKQQAQQPKAPAGAN